MLLAFFRRLLIGDTVKTRADKAVEYVTTEQLELALENHARDLEYEWNEWYEKFSKLHLRLSKRADRERKQQEAQVEEYEESPRTTALHYRRPWSV